MQTDLFSNHKDIYTVSRLNFEVADSLNKSFTKTWVTGEISNLATPQSGHIYFSLKDAKSQVRCAMFLPQKRLLNFSPENGIEIILQANITLYEPRGDYQLRVLTMTQAGEGKLQRQFNDLKLKLHNLGWFNEAHKKPLPKFPQKVGVITSSRGAVIHDILSTFAKRFPALKIIIYPTLVQGETAVSQIVQMIKLANVRQDCDALIVGRGGGSLEDLWAFNQEEVAAAIFDSKIVIVSAVGHESDVSIADFVADFRAATPTAAAVCLSQNWIGLSQAINSLGQRLKQKINHIWQIKQSQVKLLHQKLPNPQNKINQLNIGLDERSLALNSKINQRIQQYKTQIDYLNNKVSSNKPSNVLHKNQQRLLHLHQRLSLTLPNTKPMQSILKNLHSRLSLAQVNQAKSIKNQLVNLATRLNSINPLNTLSRGYAVVYDENSKLITDAKRVNIGESIKVTFAKGGVTAKVEKVDPKKTLK